MQYFLNAGIEDPTVISQWSFIWIWINWANFSHRAKSSQQLEQSVYKIWIELLEGSYVGGWGGCPIFGEGFSSCSSLLPVQPSHGEISLSQQYWRFFFFFSSIFETDLINFSFPQFPGNIKFWVMRLSVYYYPSHLRC